MAAASGETEEGRPPPGPAGRLLGTAARLFAVLSGLVVCLLAVVTVYGIVTRELASLAGRAGIAALSWIRPLSGDFEIVALGCGIAIAAAMPYCQLVRGNVAVDLFTERLSGPAKARLGLIGDLLLAVIAALLAWRTLLGGLDAHGYGETTMVLRLPVAWGYFPIAASFALLAAVSLYTARQRWREAR